jgi:hypothetical protein
MEGVPSIIVAPRRLLFSEGRLCRKLGKLPECLPEMMVCRLWLFNDRLASLAWLFMQAEQKFASFSHTDHEIRIFIKRGLKSLLPNSHLSTASRCKMEGYAKVARLMGSQEEFAILRRFRVLNMQRLLYLQAEITHLEAELEQLAKRDTSHAEREFYAKDWWSLSQGGTEEDLEQWHKFLELSEKLEQYSVYS